MVVNIVQRLVDPPTGYMRPLNEVHTEYPKYVHFADKRPSVIVYDRDEEIAVLKGDKVEARAPAASISEPAPVPVLVGTNDEKAMLLKIASEKGIKVDGRWKLPKLRKAVEAATST